MVVNRHLHSRRRNHCRSERFLILLLMLGLADLGLEVRLTQWIVVALVRLLKVVVTVRRQDLRSVVSILGKRIDLDFLILQLVYYQLILFEHSPDLLILKGIHCSAITTSVKTKWRPDDRERSVSSRASCRSGTH